MDKFELFDRARWSKLAKTHELKITSSELAGLKSLGDKIDLTDVEQIYLPLLSYLKIFIDHKRALDQQRLAFLQLPDHHGPFILGISGSVAVGKSTTARLLQVLLQRFFPAWRVQLMTTDGFLYTNSELERRKLMARKGFPESYDMELLRNFLSDVASGKKDVVYPLYSQALSDIVPGQYGHVRQPDILIMEGINTLQLPSNGQIVTSDFFDFSLYIDADEDLIETWFMQRFEKLLDLNKNNPDNFYYEWANGPREEALQMAEETWQMVNLVNLREYIAPTKPRANLILHKTAGHKIDGIYLRRY
jgi:type I pantothenate kinase